MTLARLLEMLCSPHAMKAYGSVPLTMPMTVRWNIARRERGKRLPRSSMTAVRPTAAISVRMNTSWPIGTASTPMRINMKDDPQISAINQNSAQARVFITVGSSSCGILAQLSTADSIRQ